MTNAHDDWSIENQAKAEYERRQLKMKTRERYEAAARRAACVRDTLAVIVRELVPEDVDLPRGEQLHQALVTAHAHAVLFALVARRRADGIDDSPDGGQGGGLMGILKDLF